MEDALLTCEVVDGVALITFRRPDQLNALNGEMHDMLDDAMIRVERDPAIRAAVLTGIGRGFCVGNDMRDLKSQSEGGSSEGFRHPAKPDPKYDKIFADAPPELRAHYLLLKAIGKPVIAAVNGVCAGIGLTFATTSDVRFASTDAVFTAIFARRGLTAETGLAFLLPSLIGFGAASDMLLSGRKVAAEEALAMGLVSRLCRPQDLVPAAMDYARDVAMNTSPRSTRVIKRQLWQAQRQTFMDAAILAYRGKRVKV
jgi:enoyl-CoA hydratase/carnithine racemase